MIKILFLKYFATTEPYCTTISQTPLVCLETSILELFGNNGAYDNVTEKEILGLTQQSLLDKINNVNRSGIFLGPKRFSDFFGEISFDQVSVSSILK